MVKKTGLGKGLDALFTDKMREDTDIKEENFEKVEKIKIIEIEPDRDQPRKKFDEESLQELANSIKQYGIIQPIIVEKKENYYKIIAGERRWRAAKKAGLTEMPCLVRSQNDQINREIALIENIQRENLNVIEKARGIKKLLDDYNMTQQELADRLGITRGALTNNVRILNLDHRVIELVMENNLSERHCRALLRIEDPDKQYMIAKQIIEAGDKYDDAERRVNNLKKLPKNEEKARKYEAIYRDIETSFQGFFGTKVKLDAGIRSGKIIIKYSTNEELERLLELINK